MKGRNSSNVLNIESLESRQLMAADLDAAHVPATVELDTTPLANGALDSGVNSPAATLWLADDRMENNDTFATARRLGTIVGRQRFDNLTMADGADYYRFQMAQNGNGASRLVVEFGHRFGDLDVQLFDSRGRLLRRSDSVSDNETISLNGLAAGEYIVKVYGYRGAINPRYAIRFELPLRDDALENNDSFATARHLGAITGTRSWGNLIMADSADYYRFRLPETGHRDARVVVDFQHARGDIDLQLLDSSGRPIRTSDSVSNREVVSLAGLAAGDYVVRVYGYRSARNPQYSLRIEAPTSDDRFENNDSLSSATNLGTINSAVSLGGLVMADSQDWYQFRMPHSGSPSSQITIDFQHARGDLDMRLYDSQGRLVRQSTGVTNRENISMNGLGAGSYFLQVYGYGGVHNPSYSLRVDAGAGVSSVGRTLWLNFDGANISRDQLNRWSTDWMLSANGLDPEGDGIAVQRFLQGTQSWSQREQIINRVMAEVQRDLSPYGIQVRRWNGLAVENRGDTTIFVGANGLGNPHVAGDIDFGNNNRTDIAFVGNEDWGTWDRTATALADVVLHEAGHTYGLFHVDTRVNGRALSESMGLRYSSSQGEWVQDTAFLNRTFVEYQNHGGGRGSQNAHQTMLRNFGLAQNVSAGSVVRFSGNLNGVFELSLSEGADNVSAQRLGDGGYELNVNGQLFELGGDTNRIVVYTEGDLRDRILIANRLGLDVVVNRSASGNLIDVEKVASPWIASWNGIGLPDGLLEHDDHEHDHEHDHDDHEESIDAEHSLADIRSALAVVTQDDRSGRIVEHGVPSREGLVTLEAERHRPDTELAEYDAWYTAVDQHFHEDSPQTSVQDGGADVPDSIAIDQALVLSDIWAVS